MVDTIVVERRFRGPQDSGNGGWVSGALAAHVDGPAEVTLRRPPPLEVPLEVAPSPDGDGVVLLADGEVVAEAAPHVGELDWPPFVSPERAAEASRHYGGHREHMFPGCFTCGTERAEGDGLRIFAGPVEGADHQVAAIWTPSATLRGDDGELPDPIVWAALDCPSVWAWLGDGTVALLGRMTARIERRPVVGEPHVVVGQGTGSEGRKRFGAAAVYGPDGERCAVSGTTWITVER